MHFKRANKQISGTYSTYLQLLFLHFKLTFSGGGSCWTNFSSLITEFLPHKYGKEFLLLSVISQGNFYTGHCTTCIALNMSPETDQIN